MKNTPKDDAARWRPSSLMRSLLGRIRTRPAEQSPSLRPPGERSGRGSDSIEPYLRHNRSTRPGPLE